MKKVLVLMVALAGTMSGCGREDERQQQKSAPEAVAVTLAGSRLDQVQRTIEVVGTLYGDEEAQISSKVAGEIVQTFADVGDRVPSGTPLAQIDKTDYELALRQSQTLLLQTLAKLGLGEVPPESYNLETVPTVQQAKLQADNAAARFGRAEKLFQQQPPLISEQDYEDSKTAAAVARSAYDVALLSVRSLVAEARTREAEIHLAEQRLADTAVRAPLVEGQQYEVSARLVSVGEYVKDGTPLFRVVDDNPIRFRASVPERYLSQVRLEQPVQVRVEAYTDVFEGIVRRINPQVDRESRSFMVEVNVENARGLLRPGGFARGSIATRVDENITFVPANAVLTFAGVRKVFTIKDGKAVEHQVSIGERKGDYVEIAEGLEGAPEVVVSGTSRLADGTPVEAKTAPATQP